MYHSDYTAPSPLGNISPLTPSNSYDSPGNINPLTPGANYDGMYYHCCVTVCVCMCVFVHVHAYVACCLCTWVCTVYVCLWYMVSLYGLAVRNYRRLQTCVHYTDSGITTDIEVIISSSYQVS